MYEGHAVGVVIPTYNESAHVGAVIDAIPEYVDCTYVVDDGSTDGSWAVIRSRARAANEREPRMAIADGGHPAGQRVIPIRHETNAGRGAAVKTGYRRAMEDGMDAIAVLDADGQMDPSVLDRFLDPIVDGRADYAKGNRLLARAHRKGMSRWRLFGNTVLTFLTKVASGYWQMMDPQNGYTVISARVLQNVHVDGLYDDYGFLNDLLVKLNVVDARIIDVAMEAKYGDEESGIRYSTFVPKLSSLLARDFAWRLGTKYMLFDFHPLVGLYFLGALGALGTATYLGWALVVNLTASRAVTGFVLLLMSGLLLTLAMIFDRGHNVHLEGRTEDLLERGA